MQPEQTPDETARPAWMSLPAKAPAERLRVLWATAGPEPEPEPELRWLPPRAAR